MLRSLYEMQRFAENARLIQGPSRDLGGQLCGNVGVRQGGAGVQAELLDLARSPRARSYPDLPKPKAAVDAGVVLA